MKLLFIILTAVILTGCASYNRQLHYEEFKQQQAAERADPNSEYNRQIKAEVDAAVAKERLNHTYRKQGYVVCTKIETGATICK